MSIQNHFELNVYKTSYSLAMEIYNLSKHYPKHELYSLTDQIRRSSRSICANIAEAWRFRTYPNSFSHKLNIAEAEVAETMTWLDFSKDCKYLNESDHKNIISKYKHVLSMIVKMKTNPNQWKI